MRIHNDSIRGSLWNYGLYEGMPAYRNHSEDTIYVFKDISPKRLVEKREIFRHKGMKVKYISNKQLLAMDFHDEVKNAVFDGKLGTRYYTRYSVGSYMFCKRAGRPEPTPR